MATPPLSLSPSPYTPNTQHLIPARSGVAVPLLKGQSIRVINTHGTQVIDFWAFAATLPSLSSNSTNFALPLSHYLSLPHARASANRLTPIVNDTLTTNHRAPILTLTKDTSPGVHDTLIAACDIWRYRELTHSPEDTHPDYYHDNCADNCRNALLTLAEKSGWALCEPELQAGQSWTPPAPLNLWMNIPVHPKVDGSSSSVAGVAKEVSPSCGATLSFERPVAKKGDEVELRAERDCVVVMSACPQDILEINCRGPVDAAFVVLDGGALGEGGKA